MNFYGYLNTADAQCSNLKEITIQANTEEIKKIIQFLEYAIVELNSHGHLHFSDYYDISSECQPELVIAIPELK